MVFDSVLEWRIANIRTSYSQFAQTLEISVRGKGLRVQPITILARWKCQCNDATSFRMVVDFVAVFSLEKQEGIACSCALTGIYRERPVYTIVY